MNWDIEKHIIFETMTGSRMYGTATEDSDEDLRGVAIPPMEILLDPFQGFEQADSFAGRDRCIYSLAKFMQLCSSANPNVIELLFAPSINWAATTRQWEIILENRNMFLSKKAKFTFAGFAHSQLISLQHHRQWFVNPPTHKPERGEFLLKQAPVISGDTLQGLSNVSLDLLKPAVAEEVKLELAYRAAMTSWQNFVSWRDNRNPARKAMEEKFGYDTKYASHTLRVLEQGIELLQTGKITFPRPDADWLKSIRNGSMSYEWFEITAAIQEGHLDATYDTSPLPHTPDKVGLTKLYLSLAQ